MEFMSLLGGVASDQNVSTVTRQTALYGLKLIAKRVEKPSEQFTKVSLSKCTCISSLCDDYFMNVVHDNIDTCPTIVYKCCIVQYSTVQCRSL